MTDRAAAPLIEIAATIAIVSLPMRTHEPAMNHDTGRIKLYYETYGVIDDERRPWIVFGHSLACGSAMWKHQVAAFADRYRILLFDMRGHGRSDAPASGYAFDDLVADMASLIDALRIDRPHFVGLSMGGMLGQAFAIAHPGRLRSLAIADTASHWPPEAVGMFASRVEIAKAQGMGALVETFLGRWFTPDFHRTNPADVALIGDLIRTTPIAGYAGCSYSIPRINFTPDLKGIAAPILVMAGRHDPATTVAMAEQIHRDAPGSTLAIIEGAAHLSNVEQPGAFNAAVQRLLNDAA
jgi:3-oxoadipate enol-lactonase